MLHEASADDPPQILLVDDDADLRAYLREHLDPPYRVHEAARGDEGLTAARDILPDAIVADVVMPGLDGYALCHALKTDCIPVILLTVQGGLANRLRGLETGADDYLAKPFEPAELRLRVRNLLQARRRLLARLGEADLPPAGAPAGSGALDRRLFEVFRREAASAGFTAADLPGRLGMSRAQLHRRVAAECGSTPAELLIRFRLEHATGLLARRTGTVGEVAYACGFKNLSHFVRRFREQYGRTPAAYAATAAVAAVRPGPGAVRATA